MCKRLERHSARQLADEKLLAELADIHTSSGGTYGCMRCWPARHLGRCRKRAERWEHRSSCFELDFPYLHGGSVR
ncbi:hypothetical protein ABZ511_03740 [Nocardia gamkensis]|uniref:hypothetical protein n=1 Tax=Nocardia gamkensis TaxID=352869 RepID=UPI003409F2DB